MGSEAALASSHGNPAPGRPRAESTQLVPRAPPLSLRVLQGPLALPPGRELLCRAGAGRGAGHPSPRCTVLSAASRPPPSHVQMRSGRPCPDVPLPLCCPDAHSAARRQMCGLWCWRLLMRSRCLALGLGRRLQRLPKARRPWEGGAQPGCSWTRGAGEECAGKNPAGMRARAALP